MASLLGKISTLFGGKTGEPALPPLLRDDEAPARGTLSGALGGAMFRPFSRRDAETSVQEKLEALTDAVLKLTERQDRQTQRHEELMTYLGHLPKSLESLPENAKLQSETLAAVLAHLENQGPQARQMNTIFEKVGQAAVDQRRILDTVRQRLDMLAEHDQKVAEHFNNFASALTTSSDTTRIAGEVLQSLESNIRQRDEALERIIQTHQRRHTVLLAAAVVLSAAALIAATVGVYLVQQGR